MGLATEQEATLVAEMVARYPEVKAELEAIEVSMESFDQKNAVEPPAHLKNKIMAQVQTPESHTTASFVRSGTTETAERGKVVPLNSGAAAKQSNFFKYAAAVALLLFIGSAWYAYDLAQTLDRREAQIDEMLKSNETTMAGLARLDSVYNAEASKNLALQKEVLILKTPGMKTIRLDGMEAAPDAKAMVYANTTSGDAYLEIMNLPAAPEGMQYQFWGIVDGKPVDAGMIPLGNDLSGIHPMKTVTNPSAYAISLEPVGGSDQPTGKIYVMGNS
jgi:hypothetical protein